MCPTCQRGPTFNCAGDRSSRAQVSGSQTFAPSLHPNGHKDPGQVNQTNNHSFMHNFQPTMHVCRHFGTSLIKMSCVWRHRSHCSGKPRSPEATTLKCFRLIFFQVTNQLQKPGPIKAIHVSTEEGTELRNRSSSRKAPSPTAVLTGTPRVKRAREGVKRKQRAFHMSRILSLQVLRCLGISPTAIIKCRITMQPTKPELKVN